jgi:hypothetical protein
MAIIDREYTLTKSGQLVEYGLVLRGLAMGLGFYKLSGGVGSRRGRTNKKRNSCWDALDF